MKAAEFKKEVTRVYNERGLNSLYAFLRRNGVEFNLNRIEYGLSTEKRKKDKESFLSEKVDSYTLRTHVFGESRKKSGWTYYTLRAQEITWSAKDVRKLKELS